MASLAGSCVELRRLEEDARRQANWKPWGPYLAERLFGLTGPEDNHGEDVKECWLFTDNVISLEHTVRNKM